MPKWAQPPLKPSFDIFAFSLNEKQKWDWCTWQTVFINYRFFVRCGYPPAWLVLILIIIIVLFLIGGTPIHPSLPSPSPLPPNPLIHCCVNVYMPMCFFWIVHVLKTPTNRLVCNSLGYSIWKPYNLCGRLTTLPQGECVSQVDCHIQQLHLKFTPPLCNALVIFISEGVYNSNGRAQWTIPLEVTTPHVKNVNLSSTGGCEFLL